MSLIVCTSPQCQSSAGCICEAQLRPLLARPLAEVESRRRVRDEALEEAARIVDLCNREGPYNAIGAASRIRALKTPEARSADPP